MLREALCEVCLCKHGKCYGKSHVVLESCGFNLDEENEVSSSQPRAKVPRKEKLAHIIPF